MEPTDWSVKKIILNLKLKIFNLKFPMLLVAGNATLRKNDEDQSQARL
jgi:hypothetical protein